MKPRATTHVGKGSSRHNFREFPKEAKGNSDIDRDLSLQNKFFLNNRWFESEAEVEQYLSNNVTIFNKQKERFKGDKRYYNLSLAEKYELLYYEKIFGKTINNQHKRNASRRQQCLNKNAIDMLQSKKTQPEESILQIGNKYYCPVSERQLWEIYKDYVKKHNIKFGKHIKVLDASLHVDEGTFHIHERKVFVGVNSHNETYPLKDEALGLLGIERPDMTTYKGRFNNRKQTYSAECRKIWIETCQEHGIEVETTPREYADKKGLVTIEYKFKQEQRKLQKLNEELSLEIARQKEAIQKNNSMLRSQDSTIESNKKILKQQGQKKQLLKNDIDDMTGLATEINQRMDILYNEYSNDYRSVDEANYILSKLKEEYPDYAQELIDNFEKQLHMLECEDIEL